MGNKIRKKKSGLSRCESHESSEGGYYTPTVDSATELAPPSDRCVVLCVKEQEGRERRERERSLAPAFVGCALYSIHVEYNTGIQLVILSIMSDLCVHSSLFICVHRHPL